MVTRLLVSLVLCGVSLASAQNADIGRAVIVSGSATVERGGQTYALARGNYLQQGDTVRTDKGANVRLLMSDKSLIDIGPGSWISLNQYAVSAEHKQRSVNLKLWVGRLWARVSKPFISNQPNFDVQTHNAVAGVRGTAFGVEVTNQDNNPNSGNTSVIVEEGSVNLANNSGESVLLSENQVGTVAPDGSVNSSNVTVDQVKDAARNTQPGAGSGTETPGSTPSGEQGGAPTNPNPPTGSNPPANDNTNPKNESNDPGSNELESPQTPPVELEPDAGQARIRGKVEVRE